jgi:hypothetical protein
VSYKVDLLAEHKKVLETHDEMMYIYHRYGNSINKIHVNKETGEVITMQDFILRNNLVHMEEKEILTLWTLEYLE